MNAATPPLAAFIFVLALIAAAAIDLRRGLIPDEITLGGAAFSLAAAAFSSWPAWREGLATALAGLATGLALALLLYAFGTILFRERIRAAREADPDIQSALGLGDVKLMAFIGAFLGPSGACFALLGGSVLGAAAGTLVKFATGVPEGRTGWAGMLARWRTGVSVIPFGPFLAAASLAYLFGESEIRAFCMIFAGG
ncbi:MAG: prepilin peptidase [Planctomycetota bacterium]|jgi:leader peptidase (prepilin peptidase)/N-methyltransferase|nr:prepilin peptidase [Planctomycetota bacterium]